MSPLIRSRNVCASSLNRFRRIYRSLLPLMPLALESFRSSRLRSRHQQRIRTGEGCNNFRGNASHLLLPHAHALSVGARARISQSCRRLCSATYVRAFRQLPPALGLRIRRAGRSLHRQQLQRKTQNLENVAQARRGGLSARPRGIISTWGLLWLYTSSSFPKWFPTSVWMRPSVHLAKSGSENSRSLRGGPEYRTLKRLATSNIEFCGRAYRTSQLRDLYASVRRPS